MDTQRTIGAQEDQETIIAVWRRSWSGDPAAKEAFLRRIMPASAFRTPVILPFVAPRPEPEREAA